MFNKDFFKINIRIEITVQRAAPTAPIGHTFRPLHPTRMSVNSSAVRSIGYDADTRILEVEWHSGAVYQYADVPRALYRDMMQAPSLGRFINAKIKPFHTTRDVTGEV